MAALTAGCTGPRQNPLNMIHGVMVEMEEPQMILQDLMLEMMMEEGLMAVPHMVEDGLETMELQLTLELMVEVRLMVERLMVERLMVERLMVEVRLMRLMVGRQRPGEEVHGSPSGVAALAKAEERAKAKARASHIVAIVEAVAETRRKAPTRAARGATRRATSAGGTTPMMLRSHSMAQRAPGNMFNRLISVSVLLLHLNKT